jgi:hypothetical protein
MSSEDEYPDERSYGECAEKKSLKDGEFFHGID